MSLTRNWHSWEQFDVNICATSKNKDSSLTYELIFVFGKFWQIGENCFASSKSWRKWSSRKKYYEIELLAIHFLLQIPFNSLLIQGGLDSQTKETRETNHLQLVTVRHQLEGILSAYLYVWQNDIFSRVSHLTIY